jgi:hypothetical protein
MGILDDAIKEHLELKRRKGADDSELQRLEDEAFGPPARPGDPDFPGSKQGKEEAGSAAEAPTALETLPPTEAPPTPPELAAQPAAPDTEEATPPPEPASEEQPVAEPASEEQPVAEPPSEEQPVAEPPSEELPAAEAAAEEHPVVETGEQEAPAPGGFYDQAMQDEELDLEELDLELEDEIGEPTAEAVPEAPERPQTDEQDAAPPPSHTLPTEEHQMEDVIVEPPPAPEAPPAQEPPLEEPPLEEPPLEEPPSEEHPAEETGEHEEEGDGDVLEETPEFLQDRPEDDELWFEQGEPKDFDF